MIIKMKAGASNEDIRYLARRAESLGLRVHISSQGDRVLVGLLGNLESIEPSTFAGLRGVAEVQRSSRPFRLASREFGDGDTVIRIRDCTVGGDEIVAIAGPCSVESREQILRTAEAVKRAGARMLRGGAFKPRSSPYSWQGLGEEGLRLLAEAREATGLPVVTEVMTSEQVPLVSQYADVLQIGTRNMQNFPLLEAAGETGKPVLLKRGMMSTVEEFLLGAEYVLSRGNAQVILCERGIRTFETYTRNSLDINAVPLLKQLTHLPVIVDPSHATGRTDLVTAVSRAAVAAGADGLLLEVHVEPQNAWSDAYQTISPLQFADLMTQAAAVARAVGRVISA